MSSSGPSWLENYKEDGYALVHDVLTHGECDELKTACSNIVDDLDVAKEHRTIFVASGNNSSQVRDNYFITSGDKIRFFFEKDAFNDNGELAVPKHESLNKIGHALHWWNPVFRKYTFKQNIKNVIRDLGFLKPALVQSMYIFKNARIGGRVSQHQDFSFLYTEPHMAIAGLWIALEDATLDNGCLWFQPGSHKPGKIVGDRRMKRVYREDGSVSVEMFGSEPNAPVETFKPCPVPKGSMVIINGLVNHFSNPNTSDKSRHAYTFHLIDRHESTWSPENWLQETELLPFTPVYETNPE